MTDEQINRLVAERVMGWVYEPGDPTFGRDWITHDGDRSRPRDWCTDPAAWAGLFEHLTRAGRMPSLEGYSNCGYTAEVCPEGSEYGIPMNDALPGRALALAALRAYGVEV